MINTRLLYIAAVFTSVLAAQTATKNPSAPKATPATKGTPAKGTTATRPAPPEPLFAALEFASSSVKGVLLRFVTTSDRGRIPVQMATRKRDSNYIAMRDPNGNMTQAGLTLLAQHAQEVLAELNAEARRLRLRPPTPFIVASSGIAQIKNQDELRAHIFDMTEVCMDFITASDEARFARLFLPSRTAQLAFLIDLGGGNTKGGYMQGNQWRPGDIPWGSRTLREAAKKRASERNMSYEQAVTELVREEVIPSYSKIVSEQPGFASRQVLYLYGGAVWAAANWSQPNQVNRFFSAMTLADFDQYLLALLENGDDWKRPRRGALPSNANASIRAESAAAFRESSDVFDRESLIAGVSIARAIIRASHPDVEIQFPRQALWVPGYAITCLARENDRREDCNPPAACIATRTHAPEGLIRSKEEEE